MIGWWCVSCVFVNIYLFIYCVFVVVSCVCFGLFIRDLVLSILFVWCALLLLMCVVVLLLLVCFVGAFVVACFVVCCVCVVLIVLFVLLSL